MAERKWDKYEAALLIDTYKSIDVGAFKRNIAVAKLSNNLRKRAENLGLSIDSKYRNTNGISMMLSTLVYLFSDGTKQPFKMPNNIFQEVYKIYRDNPKEFETLLTEAKKQCSDGFDISTLSMANYKSLIQNKSITGLNFEIVNKIELLKVRFIEHCIQAKRKGSLVRVENSDLVVWLKMLDSRLINIRIIDNSIFDSKDFYKFYRYRKYHELEDLLRTLVGKYNYTKLAEYLTFYVKYVKSLSDEDKLYLGFKTVSEENGVRKDKEETTEAHRGITKENSDTPKEPNKIEIVVLKTELEDTNIISYRKEKEGFIKFCKEVYNIGYVFANENLTLLLELEKKLITENIIEFSLFDFRDYEKIRRFTYQVDFKKTISRHYEKQLVTRVYFYFKVLLIYLSKSITEYNSANDNSGKYTLENEAWLRSNSKEIVSVGQDKPVLEEPRDGVTRNVGPSNKIRKVGEDKHKQVAKKDEEKVPNHENESESDDAGDINEKRFAAWLAQNAPSNNLGELYTYYSDVTDFCIRVNVLKKPLLKTVQLSVVKKVQKVVNENRLFKVTHRKKLKKIIAAVQYYVNYIKMLNSEPKTTELSISTIEKVVPLFEETASEVVKEVDEVKVVNESKQVETADVTEGINTIHQIEEADTTQKAYYTVDFNDISDLTYSFPVELKYFKKTIQIEQKWRSVYINIVKALYEQYPKAIPIGKSFTGKGRVDFGNSVYARLMIAPKEVVNDMYLETNLSAKDIVGKIKALLDLCHIFYDDIIIKYGYKDEHHLPEEKKETCTHKTKATIVQGSIFEEKEIIGAGGKLDNNANNGDIHDLLLETIIKDNIEYADKRSKGGCLWVALSSSDEEYIEKLRDFGAEFKFAKCSSALGYRDGWWTQDIINSVRKDNVPPLPTVNELTADNSNSEGRIANSVTKNEKYVTNLQESIISKMEDVVLQADLQGVEYYDLKESIGISIGEIKDLIHKSDNLIEIRNLIFHKEAFVDWDEGVSKLDSLIHKLMLKNMNYVSASQLYEYAQSEMRMFLNDNDLNDERAVFDMAQQLFGEDSRTRRYSFVGKTHISGLGNSIKNNFDIFCKFAEDQGGVITVAELAEYLKKMNIKTGNLNAQLKIQSEARFFYYDTDTLIYAPLMQIDEQWKKNVKKALERLIADVDGHIVLRDINDVWYSQLPNLPKGLVWTPLLLQGVLRFYGNELNARTIMAMEGQSVVTVHSMLVSADSPIQNFGDVVISFLVDNDIEQRSFDAEELRQNLVDAKIIQGNELINNMSKALGDDERFSWDVSRKQVKVLI